MMRNVTPRYAAAAFVALAVMAFIALPRTTSAQPPSSDRLWLRPSIGGHIGLVSPEAAKNGVEFGVQIDVGSIQYERLRLVLGIDRFSAKSTRPLADGSFSNLTISGDLRLKPFRVSGLSPYVGLGLGVNFRNTDATDPNVRAIYDGIAVGAQFLVGAQLDMVETGQWGLSGELRRTATQNVSRTAIRLGAYRRL